jgi:hypothetical protein
MALRHRKLAQLVLVALAAGGGLSRLAGGGETDPPPVSAPRASDATTFL